VVHRLDGAPRLGLVHDVVVVERTEVHELDRHAAEHDLVARRPGRTRGDGGGGDGETGPDPLAAGLDQVPGDLGEHRVVGLDGLAQLVVDPGEVGEHRRQVQQRVGRRCTHGRGCGLRSHVVDTNRVPRTVENRSVPVP